MKQIVGEIVGMKNINMLDIFNFLLYFAQENDIFIIQIKIIY